MAGEDDRRRFWSSAQARHAGPARRLSPSKVWCTASTHNLSAQALAEQGPTRNLRAHALACMQQVSHRQLLPLTFSPFPSRTPPPKTAEEDGVGRCFSRIGPFST
ncbi:hypothetical protein C2S52_007654 [Perilla frutescens var. hirtella]|nr:hypothetical protein C2S52_007654 [Perilla frutescens var. hirtella]